MLTLYHYSGKESLSLTIMPHAIRQREVRNSHAPYIDRDLKHKMFFLRDFYKKRFNKTKIPRIGNFSKILEISRM